MSREVKSCCFSLKEVSILTNAFLDAIRMEFVEIMETMDLIPPTEKKQWSLCNSL
jgi:hypothetical protein